ncbi:MAG TPA: preprotein translocase subunit SecE [Dermatophilaceae bacterium]|nr:preprotein translocase subunit SecE [Dermatophilaceae bacterium]
MSEQRTAPSRGSSASRRQRAGDGNPVRRVLGSVGLFIRQILDELRKVVRPTRNELTTYTTVVIMFVTVIMLLVFGLDTLITKLVFWVFAGS